MRGIGQDRRRPQDKKSCRPRGMRPISASGSSCPSPPSTATRTGPLLPESAKSASHRGSREFFSSLLDQVFDHLFSNPFSLGNLPAALLLCSGMGVFFLGLLEGWQGFADKYPGYRTVDHEVKKASRKLENTYRTLRLVLNTLYSSSEIRAKISKRVHDFLKDQIERGRAALNRETDAASRYESRVSDHARRLLAKYQQGNRSIRGNRRKREKLGLDEVPSYFGGPMPPFEKRFTGNPRITEGHTQAADALTLLHVNVQQLDAFLKWLSTEQKENAEKNTQKEHKQGTAQ